MKPIRHLVVVLAGLTAAVSSACAGPDAAKQALIPRQLLWGSPQRAQLRISADGKSLSWTAPVNGVLNVWVAPVDEIAAAKAVTRDTRRGISSYRWAYTSQHLIYAQDEGGNENYNIHVVDLQTGQDRNLTPNPRVQARLLEISARFPDEILVAMNDRAPHLHDVHRLNIRTGEDRLIAANPGTINGQPVGHWITDPNFEVRFAVTYTPDGGKELYQPESQPEKRDEIGGWELFTRIPFEDAELSEVAGFDRSGELMYLCDSRERDTAALFELNLKSGDMRLLAEDAKTDVVNKVLMHPATYAAQAAPFNYARTEWKVIDPAIADDLEYLRTLTDGEIEVSARSLDDTRWTVTCRTDGPIRFYLYDRPARQARLLFTNRPELEDLRLAKMHPLVIKSRDGLDLLCYLSLPSASDPDGDARPDAPLPTVLVVHGGPWQRDNWGFNAMHQFLANRGYAVLNVNFRGSRGFGKKFLNAGQKEWAGKMHDDLLDAVDWAINSGIAQKDKIAIMGESYGGYAALVGLTFTPDTFACAVDIVGPSNIRTLLEAIPPYWEAQVSFWKHNVGDHTTPEGRQFLDSRSPLSRVSSIKKPLLIVQGENDPRVKRAESDQIVKAMQDKQIPVTYLLLHDEGHTITRPRNRVLVAAVVEAFLAQHLGGACQPIGDDLKGTSLSVPAGADQIPGLEPAKK